MIIFFIAITWAFAAVGWGAVLEGVVLENKTGKPVARARVQIEAIREGTQTQPLYSDSKGNFRFTNLKAGTYRVSAERIGFVTGRFGQPAFDAAGTPIALAGEGHFFAPIRLQRPGSISGLVLDENGIGISNFPVSAYRMGARPRIVASVNSDDRGMYRFPALGPGRYAVVTAARVMEDGARLVPTFLGGAVAVDQAKLLEVRLDTELTDANLQPQPGQLYRIAGSVNAAGILAVELLGPLGMQESTVRADGSFEFSGMSAGKYTIVAGNGLVTSAETISIAGEDRFVSLKFGPLPEVHLSCTSIDGKQGANGLALFLERDLIADGQERRLDCGKSMSVPAGPWRLRPLPLSNAYLDSLSGIQMAPARGDAFEMAAAPGETIELNASLGPKPASVKGVVHLSGGDTAVGIPVGLVAVDEGVNRRMGGARLTRADASGAYRFDGLAPGDYRLFASPVLDSVATVEAFGPGGITIRLDPDHQTEAELKWE